MPLTDRFLRFADQQLSSLCNAAALKHLALYLSRPAQNSEGPALELIQQWPMGERQLPAVDQDADLRRPARERRWYPLQDGNRILGALRAELETGQDWNPALDQRLRSGAGAVSHALTLDLECLQLRQELIEQKEQTRTLVHQLRNPLAALRTYAQLLLKRLEPESQHRDLVEGMLSEQGQLDRYLKALDGLGQEALPGTTDPTHPLLLPPGLTTTTNLHLLLQPLIDRAAATAALQDRNWQGPTLWPAWTLDVSSPDAAAAVLEIVANLLENAFRYSPPGSAIGLTLLDDGLCVWDTGPAIDASERERIFERGIRGSAGRDRPGTGLGLALARDLARQHGGSLALVQLQEFGAEMPTPGNAFRLRWPLPPGPMPIR